MLSFVIALEELAKVDSSVAITVEAGSALCGQLLFQFGTEDQKLRWLVPLAQGIALGSFALTEPEAGSDTAAITTRADLLDCQWRINGSKCFILTLPRPWELNHYRLPPAANNKASSICSWPLFLGNKKALFL